MTSLLEKEELLRQTLRGYRSVAIAFSGGVDSTYLLKIAAQELGEKALGITGISATYSARERQRAGQLAQAFGVRVIEIETHETESAQFLRNPPNRCYYCKWELFAQIKKIAEAEKIAVIADGTNVDDLRDHRPGQQALKELQIRSPLRECGFAKDEIRQRSQALGLPTWDLPAFACLASRFPYGTTITAAALRQVEQAEEILYAEGFRTIRVRYHGDVARIEVDPGELPRFLDNELRLRLSEALKQTGYKYVALDLQGYRTGSMNEVLELGSHQES